MRSLLDVNVLLALLDGNHLHHQRARRWLDREIDSGWASCALTQNGFVRILSQPSYPGTVSTTTALALLDGACATPHHEFWSCGLSILDTSIDRAGVLGARQLTDVYLLALAVDHGGRFVTLDTVISRNSVPEATADQLIVI